MLKRKAKPLEEIFFADETGISLSEAFKSKAWTGPRKKVKVEEPVRNVKSNCWGSSRPEVQLRSISIKKTSRPINTLRLLKSI